MPATSTLADALIALAEEDGFGLYIAAGTGATTTITETDTGVSELRGPFTGLKIAVGRSVTVITGGTVGEDTYVSNFNPSTGVITLSPAITTGATGFIIWEPDIEHGKNVEKAVSRALTNRIGRWELRPLTFVPDGDLQGATVTDYWTATNGTPTYVAAQIFPAGAAADTFGQVGLNRVLQFVTTSGTNNLQSNSIGVPLNASGATRTWFFRVPIRAVTGTTGTVAIQVRDVTNSAAITVNIIAGSDAQTHITASREFVMMSGTFTVPEDCTLIAFRLVGSATSLTIQMGPLIAYPLDAFRFPLPNRIESDDMIGNFYPSWTGGNPSGLAEVMVGEPFTTGGITHTITDYGDHKTVTFNARPQSPLWYEEYVNGASVSALTDTTTFSSDRVHKWAKFELLNWLMNREMLRKPKAESGVPLPSVYRPLRNAALRAAERSYEPELKTVVGRR